jgi:hypothetical protein
MTDPAEGGVMPHQAGLVLSREALAELRFQELRAQSERARALFHSYVDGDDDDIENPEDAYYLYYADRAAR